MSLKARLTELYSRLVGRTFTGTYEGEHKVKGTKLVRPVILVEDTEGIVEDFGDILCALEDHKVWTAIDRPESYHLYCKEVQEGEIGDTCEFEIVEFKLFSCKDWNNPNFTAGVNVIVRRAE